MPSWYIDFTSCNDKRKHIVMSMTFKLKMDKTKKYDFSFSNVCFNSKSFYFIHDLFKLILFLCCLIHYATYLVCEVDNIKHILINVKTYLPRRDALKINHISDISKYIDKKHSYDFLYEYDCFKVVIPNTIQNFIQSIKEILKIMQSIWKHSNFLCGHISHV